MSGRRAPLSPSLGRKQGEDIRFMYKGTVDPSQTRMASRSLLDPHFSLLDHSLEGGRGAGGVPEPLSSRRRFRARVGRGRRGDSLRRRSLRNLERAAAYRDRGGRRSSRSPRRSEFRLLRPRASHGVGRDSPRAIRLPSPFRGRGSGDLLVAMVRERKRNRDRLLLPREPGPKQELDRSMGRRGISRGNGEKAVLLIRPSDPPLLNLRGWPAVRASSSRPRILRSTEY